ncbi:SDR family NAD(P)-dependent oxidoreductase [Acidiphilium sp.]|uniref:SDR family NAD(P)-dependent oxidoreductase n=1 Tax=Acidiphilium sp. TaxID=527 RepID=UPI003D0488A3
MVFPSRFEHHCAVITGGAAGIGLSVANRIIAEGGKVAIWDRNQREIDATIARIGDRAIGIAIDVTDYRAVEAAAAATHEKFGAIDSLVTSAGITGPNMTTWTYPVEDWHRVIAVNLHGVFHATKAVVPYMLATNSGRIVNIASIAGKEGNPNASAYSASKAAVIGLTKSLGKELAKTGITVNCVTPAAVRTAIFDQMTPEHIDFMLSKIPMGRFGTVEELASLICWLASPECSFTTGGVFDISGGRATY